VKCGVLCISNRFLDKKNKKLKKIKLKKIKLKKIKLKKEFGKVLFYFLFFIGMCEFNF